MSFIKKVQQKLLEKRENTEQVSKENNRYEHDEENTLCKWITSLFFFQPTLLMDTKFQFPVRFPFNPSNIRLEDIEIPQAIELPMLRKI